MKRCFSFRFNLFLFALLLGLTRHSYAASGEAATKKSQLASIQQKIEKLKNDLSESHKEQSTLSKSLQDTEIGIISTHQNLKKIQRQTDQQQKRLAGLQKQQNNAEEDLEQAQAALTLQIRNAYLMPKQETLKLLLNQQDAATLGRMITYYTYFNQSRLKQIEQLRQKITQLMKSQQLVRHTTAQLKKLQASHENEINHLVNQKTARQQIIQQLSRQIKDGTAELNSLRQNKANLEKIIVRLQKEQTLSNQQQSHAIRQAKKSLFWPTKGIITQHFGTPIEQSDLAWNGILFSAPEGQEVTAVFAGKVIFADWLKGFGMLVIIDHGDGFMSLYGRNSEIYKQVGDHVAQKELIAAVGQSGGYSESGLYFELRHNGRPVNPEHWLQTGKL